jgi:hypothetical protein
MLIGHLDKYLMAGNPGFLNRNPVKCAVWILRLIKALARDGIEPDEALFSYGRAHVCMPPFLVLSFVNEKYS